MAVIPRSITHNPYFGHGYFDSPTELHYRAPPADPYPTIWGEPIDPVVHWPLLPVRNTPMDRPLRPLPGIYGVDLVWQHTAELPWQNILWEMNVAWANNRYGLVWPFIRPWIQEVDLEMAMGRGSGRVVGKLARLHEQVQQIAAVHQGIVNVDRISALIRRLAADIGMNPFFVV